MNTENLLRREVQVAAAMEASQRYTGDWDDYEEESVDDWGFSEAQREAFLAGALYAFNQLPSLTEGSVR